MARARLIYGGPIYTMAGSPQARAEAMLICDGKVAATGSRRDVEAAAPCLCDRIDLEGRAVFPGMHDSHIHLVGWSLARQQVDLLKTTTIDQALAILAKAASQTPPGQWITGGRWDMSLWNVFPDSKQLDPVCPANPVFLSSKDGHSAWANSLAMAAAGITQDTEAPPGGSIMRDAEGQITGVFQDRAQALVRRHIPAPSDEAVADAVKAGMAHLQSLGLTTVHSVDGARALRAAEDLQQQGVLGIRIAACPSVEVLPQVSDVGIKQGFGNDLVFLGPVKMFKDGALGSRTAHMLEPYENPPMTFGLEVMTNEQLAESVALAIKSGFAAAVHAIGDRACRDVLDVLERFASESRRLNLRHRMEHAQVLTEADVPRFARLGVIASVQPSHAVADRYMADRDWGTRARWAYPFESLRRSGAALAFGSDGPVDNPDPIYGIHCAVNRNAPGEPADLSWYPQERMEVLDAVWAYTTGASYSLGKEAALGDLSPGKLADFIVLSRDIARIPKQEITSAKVLAAALGGEFVFGPLW
jgi:predicted amidohydrolase YtcJ